MFAEHSIAETAQCLTCLADSSVNFSVQGAITRYGAPQIFEMFYIGKCFVISGDGGGEGSMVQVGGAPPSFRDWLSGRRAWMPRRSSPASAVGLVLRGPLVRSRWQREPLGGKFAGSSSLLWVDADWRWSRPSGNKCRHPSPDLGQHGITYRWKRRWRGPGLVRSPASRRCWSWKHPSHCHWREPGQSCRHGRAWSSTPTLEDTQCVQGLSKVPPCWQCQKL